MKTSSIARFVPIIFLVSTLGGTAAESRSAVLDQLVDVAWEDADHGRRSVFIFDLDETTVDSTPRKQISLQLALEAVCGAAMGADLEYCEKLNAARLPDFYRLQNRYDLTELARLMGAPAAPIFGPVDSATVGYYLSGKWEDHDREIPGATRFIRDINQAGAKIYLVSARYGDTQGASTARSLRTLGMVQEGDDIEVVLRARGQSSIDFKRQAFDRILSDVRESAGARVVRGVFENEPENMNAMVERFVGATPVFVLGAWQKEEPLKEPVEKISDYL